MLVRFEYDKGGFDKLSQRIHEEWPERHATVQAAGEWLEAWLTRKFLSQPLADLRKVELELPFRGTLAIPVFADVSDGTGLLQVRFVEFLRTDGINEMVRFGEVDAGDDPAGFRPSAVLMR